MDDANNSSILEEEEEEEEGGATNTSEINEEDEMLLLSSSSSSNESNVADTGQDPKVLQALIDTAIKESRHIEDSDAVILDDDEEEEDDDDDDDVEIIDSDDSVEDTDESEILDGKVQIFLSHGALFIWNTEDVQVLREECRIIGKLSGCLPSAPRQNNQLGLPLQLMPEEAKLLQDIEAAEIVEEEEGTQLSLEGKKEAFQSMRKENFAVQQRLYKEHRKEEVTQRFDHIVAAKKAKKRKLCEAAGETQEEKPESEEVRVDNGAKGCEKAVDNGDTAATTSDDHLRDKEDDEEESNDRDEDKKEEDEDEKEEDEDKLTVDDLVTCETSTKHCLVQIFTENPWKRKCCRAKQWIYPLTERDRLRYAVFKDLWKKGYYITSGSKFGGDFLVYPGDPAKFHSHFIAVCKDRQEDIPGLDLVSLGRLSSNVRKTTLLCSFNQAKQVVYLSLQWSGIT